MGIPTRVFFTGPSAYLRTQTHWECWQRFRRLHPEWEMHFLGTSEGGKLLEEIWPEALEFWHRLEFLVHRDLLAGLASIYKKGGFYFHQGTWLEQPLTDLLGNQLVIAQYGEFTETEFEEIYGQPPKSWEQRLLISCDGIGCVAGHWLVEKLLENYISVVQEHEVLRTKQIFEEPTYATLTHALNFRNLREQEIVLRSPAGAMLPAFGNYASRIV